VIIMSSTRAGDVEVTVRIDEAGIAGEIPAFAQRLGVRLRAVANSPRTTRRGQQQ